MCMKVRVTEGVLQECCQKLSQSAEQVDQPLEEVGNVDKISSKECLQENEQLNEELENLLTTICNQKRVIPSVCLLYPFHSQNLQSQLHIQPIDLATMLEQLRTPSLFISFADILGYLKKHEITLFSQIVSLSFIHFLSIESLQWYKNKQFPLLSQPKASSSNSSTPTLSLSQASVNNHIELVNEKEKPSDLSHSQQSHRSTMTTISFIELTPSPNTVVIATECYQHRQHVWGTVRHFCNKIPNSQCHSHPPPRNLLAFDREFGRRMKRR